MTEAINKNDIATIIVTYNPDRNFSERLARVIKQVGYIIIVDNHSVPSISDVFPEIELFQKLEIIENNQNMGIAVALNQGVQRAAELGFSWVLTLDQDTVIDVNMVDNLISIYKYCPFKTDIGIIGSNARSKYSKRPAIYFKESKKDFIEVKTVMTSGSLMSVFAYKNTGPFCDDFFIEGVDLEYCLRLRRYGFKILLSCKPLMTHAAGEMEEYNFFGRTVLVANHPPWRYYYMIRNLIRVAHTYFWQEPQWVFLVLLNLFKTCVKIILFEDRRFNKIRYMCQGIKDTFLKPN